jgi:hypothetical protein
MVSARVGWRLSQRWLSSLRTRAANCGRSEMPWQPGGSFLRQVPDCWAYMPKSQRCRGSRAGLSCGRAS